MCTYIKRILFVMRINEDCTHVLTIDVQVMAVVAEVMMATMAEVMMATMAEVVSSYILLKSLYDILTITEK